MFQHSSHKAPLALHMRFQIFRALPISLTTHHVKKIPRNGITSFVFTYMDYFLGMKSKKVLKLIAQQLTVPSIRGIIPIPMV